MDSSFEYVFPVVRGNQGESEFYVSSCPVQIISKLFTLDNTEISTRISTQKALDKERIPEIARHILENPHHQFFPAIVIFIDKQVTFEPIEIKVEAQNIGRLIVPMEAKFFIFEGQHRLAAFQLAFRQNPQIGHNAIPVIFYSDLGFKRFREISAALNYNVVIGSDPASELINENSKEIVARVVIAKVEVFRALTDMERSSLPLRSKKLFTFSSIQNATIALLANYKDNDLVVQAELAISYWNTVSSCIPDWENVLNRKVSAGKPAENTFTARQ